MEEIWIPVKGYEGYYEVSNYGSVRSIAFKNCRSVYTKRKTPRVLKVCLDADGYGIVGLTSSGNTKTLKVHRIVATAFIPNPESLPCVNHKDECKTNNNVENLEWCTVAYNNRYGEHPLKLSRALRNSPKISRAVLQLTLRGELVKEYPSAKEAQRQTKIRNISSVCSGLKRYKTAGGYIWKWK